jgi:hypothetical protein
MTPASLVVVTAAALSAPAPAPRERLPHPAPCAEDLRGTWRMTWGMEGTEAKDDYEATFFRGGCYRCEPGGWWGRWALRDGVLEVAETVAPAGDLSGCYFWSVCLRRVRGGYDGDAHGLRLRRPCGGR